MSISRKSGTRKKSKAPSDATSLTDVGNGRRLAQAHGRDLRYVAAWKRWLVWDGRRWNPDDQLEVVRRAKQVAQNIYHEAGDEADDARRRELAQHARASESMPRIMSMIAAAQSEPGIEAKPYDLDTHAFLLNAQNGTVDLKTGHIRAWSRDDLLTKIAPVVFDLDAEALHWLAFLNKIFSRNQSLISYVQRLLGYCLTADTREHILPIAYGTGANGKSTLINTFLDVLGPDYSMKATAELLTPSKNAHPTERASLAGKRFVAAVETDEGRRLAEALAKELTGGDKISARRVFENFFEFSPTHKILLATNHKPSVRGTDGGIWRRLRLIPFAVSIPAGEQDKTLAEKLRAERPGILAWCVRGCLDWHENGLGDPDEVTSATAAYRAEQDVLASFLDDCCLVRPDAVCTAKELYERYATWCQANGEPPRKQREFGAAMTERGFERYKSNGTRYRGVGVVDDSQTERTE